RRPSRARARSSPPPAGAGPPASLRARRRGTDGWRCRRRTGRSARSWWVAWSWLSRLSAPGEPVIEPAMDASRRTRCRPRVALLPARRGACACLPRLSAREGPCAVVRGAYVGERRSIAGDVEDRLGEGLRGLLRQIVSDAARDDPV